jgi:hypothetical protein
VQQDRKKNVCEPRDSGRSDRSRAGVVVSGSGVGRVKQRSGNRSSESAEEMSELLQSDDEDMLE